MRSTISKPKSISLQKQPTPSIFRQTTTSQPQIETKQSLSTTTQPQEDEQKRILIERRSLKSINNDSNIKSLSARSKFPVGQVSRIRMGIFSAEEIRKLSVVEVKSEEPDGQETVNDPAMGPRDNEKICPTCRSSVEHCEGHYGRIEFPQEHPLYNPAFIKHLSDIFSSICKSCAYPLLSKDKLKELVSKNPDITKRLHIIRDASADIKQCTRCADTTCEDPCPEGSRIYTRTKESHDKHMIIYRLSPKDKDNDLHLDPLEAYQILSAMEDPEVLDYFGFSMDNHPKNMIMFNMLVFPPTARLMNVIGDRIVEHDMTKSYREIVKHVNKIKQLIKQKQDTRTTETVELKARTRQKEFVYDYTQAINENLEKLVKIIAVLFGEAQGYPGQKKQSQNIKGFLQTKHGLFRQKIMSHRINYVARSIIAADPSIKFGQIGIPYAIAETQPVEKRITKHNIDEYRQLYDAGKIKFITKTSGPEAHIKKAITKKNRKNFILEEGDIIERVLQDGDWVIYNRQPSIHSYSLRAMQVKVGPYKQIRIHMSDTKLSNADFDGDESNIYIIRTVETEAEAITLMNTKTCIMSSQTNAPGIGLFYDAITGMYQLTRKETDFKLIKRGSTEIKTPYFTPSDFDRILRDITNRSGLSTLKDRLDKHRVPEYSGKAVFSAILPDNFNYSGNNNVVIRDGVLISGQITAANVSNKSRAIQQFLYKWYGEERAAEFITDATRIAYNFLQLEPITVGILSCIAQDVELATKNEETVRKVMAKGQFFVDEQPAPKSYLDEQKQEQRITMKLNVVKDVGQKETMEILGNSGLVVMAKAGTKGDGFNLAQIGSALGQQNIAGLRIQKDKEMDRCISYFPQGSKNIQHQGFCGSSFLEGINVEEMFFMQQAAREGLLDTTTKTASAGAKHHEIVKYFEDHIAYMDGTIRNSSNEIIQMVYGNIGFDPKHMINVQDPELGVVYANVSDPFYSCDMLNTEFGF